ncbi:MAG: cupredoxin domain-containing protein [Nitrososphaerota archaeon]
MQSRALLVAVTIVAVTAAGLAILYYPQPSQPPHTTSTLPKTTGTYTTNPYTAAAPKEVTIVNPVGSSTDTSKTFEPPHVKLVRGVNNTVIWVNEDIVPHTATSIDRLFDSILQPGQRASYTFNNIGVYRYSCTLHPWMNGVVEVIA